MNLNGTMWQIDAAPSWTGWEDAAAEEGEALFTCDGVNYEQISLDGGDLVYWTTGGDDVTVYDHTTSEWADAKYRTISFVSEPGQETDVAQFKAWLGNNAEQIIPKSGTVYKVWESQLEAIADAIRRKLAPEGLAGTTWQLNAAPSFTGFEEALADEGALFTCDGVNYEQIYADGGDLVYFTTGGDDVTVYTGGAWADAKYRTITFVSEPTEDDHDVAKFKTWLGNNAATVPMALEFPIGFVNAIGQIGEA